MWSYWSIVWPRTTYLDRKRCLIYIFYGIPVSTNACIEKPEFLFIQNNSTDYFIDILLNTNLSYYSKWADTESRCYMKINSKLLSHAQSNIFLLSSDTNLSLVY